MWYYKTRKQYLENHDISSAIKLKPINVRLYNVIKDVDKSKEEYRLTLRPKEQRPLRSDRGASDGHEQQEREWVFFCDTEDELTHWSLVMTKESSKTTKSTI